jgi:signal peptidase II
VARHPWSAAIAVALAVVVADQALKALVVGTIDRGEQVRVVPGLELVNVRNDGIAFGLLGDAGAGIIVLTLVTTLALLAFFAVQAERPGMWLAVGLVMGGAAGNLIDRVRLGAAIDYLDPARWPAFNLADVAITAGVALLAWLALSQPASAGPDEQA